MTMNDRIADRISRELGVPDLGEVLAERGTGSELNSLLLAVYDRRVRNLRAPSLLQQYRKNRFVQPSGLDMIALLEQELQTLRFWKGCGFEPEGGITGRGAGAFLYGAPSYQDPGDKRGERIYCTF